MAPSTLLPPYDLVWNDEAPDPTVQPLQQIAERLERDIATVHQLEAELSMPRPPPANYSPNAFYDSRQMNVEHNMHDLVRERGRMEQLRKELAKVELGRFKLVVYYMLRRSGGDREALYDRAIDELRKAKRYKVQHARESASGGVRDSMRQVLYSERRLSRNANNVTAHGDTIDIRIGYLEGFLRSILQGVSYADLAREYLVPCPVKERHPNGTPPAYVSDAGVHTDSEAEYERNDARSYKSSLNGDRRAL
ncbi:hypothetical protein JCM8547_008748 [Rhodosporidiobolus lusitaniae]